MVVDYKLPEMNGFQFTTAARRDLGEATPPMILFSSVSPLEATFRENAERIGYAATLTKPAKSQQLLGALVKALAPDFSRHAPEGKADPATAADAGQGFRVLLVDDNSINQKVGQKILKTLGYDTAVAGSGEEAVESCQATNFDMVLMDIEMPDMDGIAATRAIREILPRNQAPYIVALTANAMSSERESYLKSGMDDYLSKPIDVEALAASIEAARRFRGAQAAGG